MLVGSAKGLFVIIENIAKHFLDMRTSNLCKLKIEMSLITPKFGRRTTVQLTLSCSCLKMVKKKCTIGGEIVCQN